MARIAILVSGKGRGTNMEAIIRACQSGVIPQSEVVLVVGTRPDAPALAKAEALGVPTMIVNPRDFPDDAAYGDTLLWVLERVQPDLICLAGYMRLLPERVVKAYPNRIMNIHPALLPQFGGKGMYGLRVHEAVLQSGAKETGCTVHFVDEHYDTGPIILQRTIPVLEGDTPETLAERLLPVEHATYVEAIRLFAEGRLKIEGNRVQIIEQESAS
ncbi:phosphoribosylglycinamide formyltransferase-1 [Armatimonadetes bacterium GBS]|mgnify:FL=1|jgi:formyltetrahydrofolate-dependent phosphoribosylglycinamide formyltransferase|nr:Phosphoribosylglycinamide formyltransferase [bacterium HR14]CUU09286.1 phosphoribosylglycinamide formyltransferase-1 [Armatimonadetes bacterium GBS]CUU36736.1 phosphoribosylglycinamide formyltransferase-1 [Armatimonadetes bacterium GXS]